MSTSLCVSSLAGVSADSLSLTRRKKPDTKWTQRLTFLLQHYTVAWTHLQPKKSKATISTYSRLSQVTGLYIIIWTSRPGPVLTTLERLLHCACIWVNIGLGVLVYIVNLLISAHIQLVHIWILYVCFLSLCSHRPIDIFLIWKINCGWIFCFVFFFLEKFSIQMKTFIDRPFCKKNIKRMVRILVSILIQLPVLSFIPLLRLSLFMRHPTYLWTTFSSFHFISLSQ